MTATAPTLERLYSLRELNEAGYGDRRTIMKLIHENKVPARKIGTAFKIRESDLPLIGEPLGAAPSKPRAAAKPADDLGDYVKALVDRFATLPSEEKATLWQILSPAS